MEQYFEWDEAKNRKNQKKHDVSFETASLVFEDPLRISIQDRHTDVKNVGNHWKSERRTNALSSSYHL
jgi:uncharacterized DUF497 family protein